MLVFTQELHALVIRQDTCEKRHSKFELHGDQIGIFPVFKPLGKILKIGLAVWKFFCNSVKYLRIWIIKSVWKNLFKTQNIAVNLTELSYLQEHQNWYKIQLFQLIIIFQLFQVYQLMDVIMLFHLICYLINLEHFKFSGWTHQCTHRHGECTHWSRAIVSTGPLQ